MLPIFLHKNIAIFSIKLMHNHSTIILKKDYFAINRMAQKKLFNGDFAQKSCAMHNIDAVGT